MASTCPNVWPSGRPLRRSLARLSRHASWRTFAWWLPIWTIRRLRSGFRLQSAPSRFTFITSTTSFNYVVATSCNSTCEADSTDLVYRTISNFSSVDCGAAVWRHARYEPGQESPRVNGTEEFRRRRAFKVYQQRVGYAKAQVTKGKPCTRSRGVLP